MWASSGPQSDSRVATRNRTHQDERANFRYISPRRRISEGHATPGNRQAGGLLRNSDD